MRLKKLRLLNSSSVSLNASFSSFVAYVADLPINPSVLIRAAGAPLLPRT
jgi:hypothetical protein